ncbi:Uncharacterised protein [Mycobacterium tuberculosis]|uniref:Uncharacterized protein n=1 Tax=Mycobacterium tuberculosis TaxID=1773 RepID=A0A0U0RI67_MYCTX|nr:Uncharacterised protein [Mycobacterium tuberculosis]CFE76443.1 Uncharacterised protein [Mycobacterium tuberculosis]CKR52174.1 Uncharacterised protein [Mycobacterium tuberculosis]CKR93675.1 Uncharacterised protein [Mycobacterium tuberculosis]CKT61551.1 Uncharacterised protein [Mycobacterium tuberculosis]
MRYGVAFETAGVVEVELLQRLARWEAGGPDASFAAVGFAGRHLALQTRCEELLIAPSLGAGAVSELLDGPAQGGGFQRPGQIRQLGGHIAAVGSGLGCHQATGPSRPNTVS